VIIESHHTGKFYIYYFTRDCSGVEDLTHGKCFEVPKTMTPPADHMVLSLRDYVRPGTQRGPDSSLVLPSMVLKLEKP
jgi:hypothetical protein